MATVKHRRYGKVAKTHSLPYGALSGASQELKGVFYGFGYRRDEDIPELPAVPVEFQEVPTPEDEASLNQMRRIIGDLLGHLSLRDEQVLRMRYVGDLTLEEVGWCLGVTRERARQLEVRALRRLKQHPNRLAILRQFVYPDDIETTVVKAKNVQKAKEELIAKRKAFVEFMRPHLEDKNWVDHLQRTNPALYGRIQRHVSSYIHDFLDC